MFSILGFAHSHTRRVDKDVCFLKRLFYTKKQGKKVNKDWKKLETMKKLKNSEKNK
jgi:hypothetical protein